MNSFDPKSVDLSKVMAWYSSHCNGDWEHASGVSISTLDNPGWLLKADLTGTSLEDVKMNNVSEGCDESSHPEIGKWIDCSVKNNEFVGASDPTQLPRLIAILNGFIESTK